MGEPDPRTPLQMFLTGLLDVTAPCAPVYNRMHADQGAMVSLILQVPQYMASLESGTIALQM